MADEVRRRLPDAHVVASHEVAPEFREYERASTTAVDAYLGPVLADYLWSLADRCREAGLVEPLVMRSSGGVCTLDEAARHPSLVLVSGPAAGVVGAARIAALAGVENAISLDMGGTSTDVCLIAGGRVGRAAERELGGFPIRLPTVDLQTVGAGGGSIVWRDAGGALRVGPQSAGADPGPACYGRGGLEPTVTDANLVLGRLPATLAGGLELDRTAAELALGDFDAQAVVDVVNAEMLRALRLVSVERGHDPRDFALVAFGGAGPLHACELAEELGIRKVLVPAAAGVLSALGLVASEERRDRVRSYVIPFDEAGLLPRAWRGRPSLQGPVLRADGVARGRPRRGVPPRARGALRLLPTAGGPIELVAVRSAEVTPGPELRLHGGDPRNRPRPRSGGARRRHLLASPRVGGG